MLIRGITKCIIDIYNRQALAQAALRSSRAEKRRRSESPREGVALSCSCNYDAWNSSTGRRPIPFYNGIRSVLDPKIFAARTMVFLFNCAYLHRFAATGPGLDRFRIVFSGDARDDERVE